MSDDLVSAVVARGVILQPGLDQNGEPHWSAPWVEHHPGSVIMLPAPELARLQQTGALVSTSLGVRKTIPA